MTERSYAWHEDVWVVVSCVVGSGLLIVTLLYYVYLCLRAVQPEYAARTGRGSRGSRASRGSDQSGWRAWRGRWWWWSPRHGPVFTPADTLPVYGVAPPAYTPYGPAAPSAAYPIPGPSAPGNPGNPPGGPGNPGSSGNPDKTTDSVSHYNPREPGNPASVSSPANPRDVTNSTSPDIDANLVNFTNRTNPNYNSHHPVDSVSTTDCGSHVTPSPSPDSERQHAPVTTSEWQQKIVASLQQGDSSGRDELTCTSFELNRRNLWLCYNRRMTLANLK